MNICPYCGSDFELNPFGAGGKNRIYCYNCMPEGLSRNERKQIKSYLDLATINKDKIKRGCSICGYNKNATALEWHHPNNDKEHNPSNLLKDNKIEEYRQEIQKCILLCANCHRELHHPQFDIELYSVHSEKKETIDNNKVYIELVQNVISHYQETKNVKETAKFFNCDETTVYNLLKKHNQSVFDRQQGRKIAMFNMNDTHIKTFNSVVEAYDFLNKQYSGHIASVCRGKRKSAYGYKWRYI